MYRTMTIGKKKIQKWGKSFKSNATLHRVTPQQEWGIPRANPGGSAADPRFVAPQKSLLAPSPAPRFLRAALPLRLDHVQPQPSAFPTRAEHIGPLDPHRRQDQPPVPPLGPHKPAPPPLAPAQPPQRRRGEIRPLPPPLLLPRLPLPALGAHSQTQALRLRVDSAVAALGSEVLGARIDPAGAYAVVQAPGAGVDLLRRRPEGEQPQPLSAGKIHAPAAARIVSFREP